MKEIKTMAILSIQTKDDDSIIVLSDTQIENGYHGWCGIYLWLKATDDNGLHTYEGRMPSLADCRMERHIELGLKQGF